MENNTAKTADIKASIGAMLLAERYFRSIKNDPRRSAASFAGLVENFTHACRASGQTADFIGSHVSALTAAWVQTAVDPLTRGVDKLDEQSRLSAAEAIAELNDVLSQWLSVNAPEIAARKKRAARKKPGAKASMGLLINRLAAVLVYDMEQVRLAPAGALNEALSVNEALSDRELAARKVPVRLREVLKATSAFDDEIRSLPPFTESTWRQWADIACKIADAIYGKKIVDIPELAELSEYRAGKHINARFEPIGENGSRREAIFKRLRKSVKQLAPKDLTLPP